MTEAIIDLKDIAVTLTTGTVVHAFKMSIYRSRRVIFAALLDIPALQSTRYG